MLRLLTALALVASVAASPSAQVEFRADAASFQYAEEEALVEVYLSFRAESLPFLRSEEGFLATVPTRIQLRPASMSAPSDASSEPVYDQTFGYRYAVVDTNAVSAEQVFVEQVRMLAAPGEYAVSVTIDADGRSVGAEFDLTIPDYAASAGTSISSIQLATAIGQAEPDDAMSKSGLTVRPNPDAGYAGAGAPVRYYAEVYAPPSVGDGYTLLSFLAESATGGAMQGYERRQQRPTRPVDVAVGSLGVEDVPSGIYYLRLVVLDEANQAVAEQSKRVFVINPDVVVPEDELGTLSYEESLFAAMGEEEIDLNVRHAFVIATERQRQQIRDLDSDERRRQFLANFWTARDDDGLRSVNTARQSFYERLNVVNDRFDEPGGVPGFETQRGRVYLTYGPPAEIDRRPFDTELNPHEIWTYENIPGEGRSVFVFVDRFGASQFELVHSDVTGEVSVPNWQAEVMR